MKSIMILAGGTGGHVFPALAVAHELRERGVPIVWVGTEKGIESKIVPAAGFSLATMRVQGLRRKGFLQYLRAPFIILLAAYQSLRILLRYKPCALLGMGGFVAGPCALIGVLLRKPLIIHEQNAIIGLTNRILAPFSDVMFTGFPIKHKNRKLEYSGNPVRKALLDIASPEKRFAQRAGAKRILVLGGSQGSSALNNLVPQALHQLPDGLAVEVWHQTGTRGLQSVQTKYANYKINGRVEAFIDEVDQAYAWADLIICRSGAITLAEIAIVGLGAILVPYPYAVDDHQTANARAFVAEGAAYLMSERELDADKLSNLLANILSDSKQLLTMACAAHRLGRANASKRVADECMSLCGINATASA